MAQSISQYFDINIKQSISGYYGNDITCYPGSNQTDDGKLQLEFNMARFITRLSSKNFCTVKPSFEISVVYDKDTAAPALQISEGQASINGMDLIMTSTCTIDPPMKAGTYYLAFKLARDSSNNVLGDLVYGVETVFKGVYLTYFDTKPDPLTDMDMLYLGQITWDGTTFTEIKEDEDKYGRLWAEDILSKLQDPKHPDITRINLQEWINKVPDWYFSKEGDTIYGPISIKSDRNSNTTGVIINVDKDGSYITVKDPTQDNNLLQFFGDVNRDGVIDTDDITIIENYIKDPVTNPLNDLQLILADVNHDGKVDEKDLTYIKNFVSLDGDKRYTGDTGNIYYIDNCDRNFNMSITNGITKLNINKASIYQDQKDDILHIHNPGDICIDSQKDLKLEATDKIELSTESAVSPKLTLDDDKVSITDPTAPDLEFTVSVTDGDTIQQKFGKAIWKYDNITQNVTLLQDNVNYLDIVPNGIYRQNLNVNDTLYIGSVNNTSTTYLKQTEWKIQHKTNTGKNIVTTPTSITITNKDLSNTDNSYILLKNDTNTIHTQVLDDGKIELLNNTRNPSIIWRDGNSLYDVTLEKIIGKKTLNIKDNLTVVQTVTAGGLITGNGLKTSNGVLTFSRGTNDATITKDNNSNTLRTSHNLYVGSTGTGALNAGNTTITGTLDVGSSKQCKIDASGNINTSGTITGSKVYNAVYNDYAEILRKPKDETIQGGDIVCIKEDGLAHKVNSEQDLQTMIGICSDTAGFILGGKDIPEDEQVIVGLVGQLWVKTNNTNLHPGMIVTPCADGTFDNNVQDCSGKKGITLTNVTNGRVRILYNG